MSLNISSEHRTIYKYISDYFGNTACIKGKDLGNYSIYYSNVSASCLLCLEDRFLVVITHRDYNPIGFSINLNHISWVSFQTRSMETSPIKGLKSINYNSIQKPEFLNDKIRLVEKKEDRNVYHCTKFPIEIELLYTENTTDYASNGNIKSAIETFNCVISFII
jgi:hypothetical protein